MLRLNKKILLIDDDAEFLELLEIFLAQEGFDVSSVQSGKDAMAKVEALRPDLCILDIMMPDLNGMDLLKWLSQHHSDIPVIMLTAKSDAIDKVLALELGADDFVTKPPNTHELSARIKAVLRRIESGSTPTSPSREGGMLEEPTTLSWDDYKRLFYVEGVATNLTGIEYEILKILAKNRGFIVSKEVLSEEALGRPLRQFDRSLDVHISNIRKKLSKTPLSIKSIRSRGYQLLL